MTPQTKGFRKSKPVASKGVPTFGVTKAKPITKMFENKPREESGFSSVFAEIVET